MVVNNQLEKTTLLELNSPLLPIDQISKSQPVSLTIDGVQKTIYFSSGKYYLADGRCHHRNMKLEHATICHQDHTLVCPYHGKKNKAQVELFLKWGFLWMKDPASFFQNIPQDYIFCGSRSVELPAPFHVVVDNFNEGSHTPFVHRFTGPEISQIDQAQFRWTKNDDCVDIYYSTPQKKNLLFYGLNWKRQIQWDIHWKTFVSPLYMKYYSEWSDQKTKKKLLEENITYFFLVPIDEKTTRIIPFVFVKPLSWLRFLPFLVKKISMVMTMNQINEDLRFYAKISDLPVDIEHLNLDQYDQPLLEIRQRAKSIYQKYF